MLFKILIWEKGEMSVWILMLLQQEMEDWRGVKDLGLYELLVGVFVQEIMDVKDGDGFDEGFLEEGKMVVDLFIFLGSEMMGSEIIVDFFIFELSEVVGMSFLLVSCGSIGLDR